MRNALPMTMLLGLFFALAGQTAWAGQYNSVNDCVVGKRVKLNNGQHGKITRIDRAWSYCYVLLDDTGKELSFLYSLISDEGSGSSGGGKAGNDKLVVGKYNCLVGDQASGEMRITGPSTYEAEGKKGTYRLDAASGKIVFESGPFSSYHAKRLDAGRIGMNLTGGTFYNLTCEPPR